jgi:hypothetical protein
MIKEYEFYHGVIFTKLIHFGNNISLRPYSDDANASYVLNDSVGLYIKHSAKRLSPWNFSFQKKHQDEILEMKSHFGKVFLLLICGEDGVVTLSFDELKKMLDEDHGQVEWISASRTHNKEYTVKGSDGGLGRKVGKNDFPKKIFELIDPKVFNTDSLSSSSLENNT